MNSGRNPVERHIGHWRLIRRLAVGGMAIVFLALRETPSGAQRACVKQIRPEYADDEEFRTRFLREARVVLNSRGCANIVGYLDSGETSTGELYFATEFVDGCDLRQIQQVLGGLPTHLVVYIAVEIANALRWAHEEMNAGKGIVHRDIKPSNILISHTGDVKVADFGVVKLRRTKGQTQTKIPKGTITYMSPEMHMLESFDHRSDLWSLGVILYELLSEHRPFEADQETLIVQKIVHGERKPLAEVARADAPLELVEIIEELMAIDLAERTPSAEALLEQLNAFGVRATSKLELGKLVAAITRKVTHPPADDSADEPSAPAAAASSHPRAAKATLPTVAARAAREPSLHQVSPRKWALPVSLAAGALVLSVGGAYLLLPSGSGDEGRATRHSSESPARPATTAPVTAAASTAPEARSASRPLPGHDAATRPVRPRPALSTTRVTAATAPDAAASARASAAEVAPAAPAFVLVGVAPAAGSSVWVGGRRRGGARTRLRLPPGAHVISARGPSSRVRRRVTVRSGDRVEMFFDLQRRAVSVRRRARSTR